MRSGDVYILKVLRKDTGLNMNKKRQLNRVSLLMAYEDPFTNMV